MAYDEQAAISPRASTSTLEVEHLSVGHVRFGPIIEDLTLCIGAGEALALVGESGCGKSLTALSLMRLLPQGFAISQGAVRLDGDDLSRKIERELNAIRGHHMAMLFQQPQAMLDPTATVAAQVSEPLRLHLGMNRRAAHDRVIELLREVGIPEPEQRARQYAFQLSGGMAQRVMIAAALSGNPKLLIADEPTTALDVTVQAQILLLLQRARQQRGLAVLLITHDLSVVAAFADRVAVMYAGRIVEQGTVRQVLRNPQHPYTQTLVDCSLLRENADGTLYSYPGAAPGIFQMSKGCRYHPRCAAAKQQGLLDQCRKQEPVLSTSVVGSRVRCWAVGRTGDAPT